MKAQVEVPSGFDWQGELTELVHMLGAFTQLTAIASAADEPLPLDYEELNSLACKAWNQLSLIDQAARSDVRLAVPAKSPAAISRADQVGQAREWAAG